MKRLIRHLLVLFLCFFYAVSALEVSIGNCVNEFGDSFDTYVPAHQSKDPVQASQAVWPEITPALASIFLLLTGWTASQLLVNYGVTTVFLTSRVRLHARHAVWII